MAHISNKSKSVVIAHSFVTDRCYKALSLSSTVVENLGGTVHQAIEIADDSKTLVIHEKAEVPDLLSTHYHYGYMRRLKNRPELAGEISGIIESAENFGSEEQILKLVVIEAQNSYQLTFWFSESWKIIGCMIGQRRDVF